MYLSTLSLRDGQAAPFCILGADMRHTIVPLMWRQYIRHINIL